MSAFKFGLKSLFFSVAFLALAITGLCVGGIAATLTAVVVAVVISCVTITFLVTQGQTRACAAGFLVPIIVYAGSISYSNENEFDPYRGELVTSQVLKSLFDVMATKTWKNGSTGETFHNYDQRKDYNPNVRLV